MMNIQLGELTIFFVLCYDHVHSMKVLKQELSSVSDLALIEYNTKVSHTVSNFSSLLLFNLSKKKSSKADMLTKNK